MLLSESYDYIVVGAGSAGCVVASRLSEDPKNRVLLIEAGGKDTSPWIRIPIGYAKTFLDPRVNWLDESEPEHLLNDRIMYQPRGKVLGGTSSINGMVYMRGNRADYDDWRRRGCVGWDYESVLPYFRKAEDNERGEDRYHGVGGPLHVADPQRWELGDRLLEACEQAGLPRNPDFNGAVQDGAGYYQTTMKSGLRWSTARGYLRPARARDNLRVVTNAQATRIVMSGGRATGVEFQTPSGRFIAHAKSEVIVSCGAIGSPQLLMLSGIGPGQHLQDMGIVPWVDSPEVGGNLQDHFGSTCSWKINRPFSLNVLRYDIAQRAKAGLQYAFLRRGLLARNAFFAGGFMRSRSDLSVPDLQLQLVAFSTRKRTRDQVEAHPFPAFSISSVIMRPKSRGTVRLKANDPFARPELRFNFLQDASDVDAILAGVRMARSIAGQEAMKDLVEEEVVPGARIASDEQLAADVYARGVAYLHPVGTCAMGGQPNSVLDPHLRVRGVDGLRVVDASVMPVIIAANTNAPTIMIAEKAADLIQSGRA